MQPCHYIRQKFHFRAVLTLVRFCFLVRHLVNLCCACRVSLNHLVTRGHDKGPAQRETEQRRHHRHNAGEHGVDVSAAALPPPAPALCIGRQCPPPTATATLGVITRTPSCAGYQVQAAAAAALAAAVIYGRCHERSLTAAVATALGAVQIRGKRMKLRRQDGRLK